MQSLTEEYYCGPAYRQAPEPWARELSGPRWLCPPCAAALAAARMYAVRLPREGAPSPCESCRPAARRPRLPLTPERFLQARLSASGLEEEEIAARQEAREARHAAALASVLRFDAMFAAPDPAPASG